MMGRAGGKERGRGRGAARSWGWGDSDITPESVLKRQPVWPGRRGTVGAQWPFAEPAAARRAAGAAAAGKKGLAPGPPQPPPEPETPPPEPRASQAVARARAGAGGTGRKPLLRPLLADTGRPMLPAPR